ncbi:hypothetical protein HPC49_29210 [Pyxidicoccus fallax]|uniref:Phosphatidic acid phosphatase type 2/haloperoxidase domain-containing protein n=1 Tax=Pyxidicoccus fallax TaxID=394095 RepID=A0A848LJH8_9BACT|nr:hypothetical protein [Pyxidicoccus fallax]NMO17836.1 hypothetical protein [Pyxidicoccus fallax]NPC82285.1 hypothetical protein [Pyxidicoccus fallax]
MRLPHTLIVLSLLAPMGAQAQAVNDLTRVLRARQVRVNAANFQSLQGQPLHRNNQDLRDFGRFAEYSKGLPHDALGEPDPVQFDALLAALLTGNPAQLEAVVLGGERMLANPQAGFAFVLEGADAQAITMGPAPDFDSADVSGEMIELYWMSLVRDVRFDQYAANPLIAAAANALSNVDVYRGARAGNGFVTPATVFRADFSGAVQGPFLSQFLVKTVPFGGGPLAEEADINPPPPGVEPTAHQPIEQRIWTRFPGDDRVTAYNEWLDIQNGALPADPVDTLEDMDDVRRYIRNGRDLAEWVHFDYPIQSTLNGALVLARQGDFLPKGLYDSDPKASPRAYDPNSPYRFYENQEPFVTFGNTDAQALAALVSGTTSLRGQWFQKWQVHRRLRPEEYGGRVHNTLTGARVYPVPQELLNSPVLPWVFARNAQRNLERGLGAQGTYLLNQAFPEGSPIHPAYASGHSTYIGAGITAIKALYGDFPVINPQVVNADGTALLPFAGTLMMFDELDKLASNVGVARLFAGVHYRSDHDNAVRLGELYALRTLQDWVRLYPEKLPNGQPFAGFKVRTLGGNTLTVDSNSPKLPNFVSRVDRFILVNVDTNQDIRTVYNGDVIDLSDLGNAALTLRADTFQNIVGSVRFVYDGATVQIENAPPYALAGDNLLVDYNPFKFTPGTHVLTATPFSDHEAEGVGGVPLTIRFTVQE